MQQDSLGTLLRVPRLSLFVCCGAAAYSLIIFFPIESSINKRIKGLVITFNAASISSILYPFIVASLGL